MSYGLKWTLEFENVEETADYKIELYKLDYAGADGTIDTYPNGEPLFLNNRGSRSGVDDVIIGTEFIIKFICDKSELATFDDLFYCKHKEWQCQIYKDETLINVGYIRPENFNIEWFGAKYTAALSFTDGLNDLNNQDYLDKTPLFVPEFTDRASLLTTLKRALIWTDVELPFKVQLNTYETTLMTSTECALAEIYVSQERWRSFVNGQAVYASCYKVVADIMRLFNCVLRQNNGHYEIVNYQEYNSYIYIFDWATLTQQSRTARNMAIDWSAGKFTERGQISKIAPYKYVDLIVRNFSSPENELTNPTFTAETGSPVTGWNNGPGTFAFNQFFVDTGPKLTARDAFIYTAQEIHYFESDGFGLTGTSVNDELKVTLRMNPAVTMTTASDQKPLWYLALVRPNGSVYFDKTQNTFNGPQIVQRTIPVTGGDGTYKLRFYVQPVSDTTVSGYRYDFTEISAIHLRESGPISMDYKVRLTNNVDGIAIKQLEIVFADTDQASDLGALRDSTDALTTEWNRYGKTDEEKISILRGLQLLNDNSTYRNYIRTEFLDPNDTITATSVISIDSRVYRFIGYNKNPHKCTIKAEMVEIQNTDISYSTEESPLQSQDGTQTGGSSGTDTTGSPGTGGDVTNVTNITNVTNNYITIAENPIERVNQSYEGTITAGTYFDIIPAPGAGKFIQLLDVIVLGNTTSASSEPAFLKYEDATIKICQIPIHNTAAVYYEIKPDNYLLQENKAIQLGADATVTTGTGGMKYIIYYRIIEWTGFEDI